MNQMMQIQNQEIQVKEFNGQRVVTFKDIDLVHERPSGTARKAFNRHKSRFIEGSDVFVLNMDESKKQFSIHAPNGIILMTESGYVMLAKVFDDDLAWAVQRQLVNCYFKVKEACEQANIEVTAYEPLTKKEWLKIADCISRTSNEGLPMLKITLNEIAPGKFDTVQQFKVTVTGENLAEQLSQHIKKNDLTLQEFAEKAQLPKSAVSMYCSGKTKNPTPKNMKKITMAMSCEL